MALKLETYVINAHISHTPNGMLLLTYVNAKMDILKLEETVSKTIYQLEMIIPLNAMLEHILIPIIECVYLAQMDV